MNTDKQILGTLTLGVAFALAGCTIEVTGDDTGSATDQTSVQTSTETGGTTGGETTGDETTGGETTGVVGTGPEHCGTITSDETWTAALSPHVITCDVHLEGGTVTIEPGVEVRVESDLGLFVSEDGGTANLRVLGSADAPVRFVSASGVDAGL